MLSVDDRDAVIWLHRRAGFGLTAAEVDAAATAGPAAELARLVDVDGAGGQPLVDPWDDGQLPLERTDKPSRLYAVNTWLDLMTTSAQPLVERMAWLWHGHFVSAFDKVKVGRLMVDQVRLFRHEGLGSFAALLRAVTIDPAMMLYLDLRTSTGSQPNENYAREVLELFTVGVGNYAEADVQAGARALTGWALADKATAHFVARRHDDTAQHYLGRSGVHDLDTMVGAITAQPAMATFIARTVALDLLGAAPDDLVGELAAGFTGSGLDVRTLVRATLQAGLDGASAPIVVGPVPWLVWARRVTGAQLAAPMEKIQLACCATPGSSRCTRRTSPAGRADRRGSPRRRWSPAPTWPCSSPGARPTARCCRPPVVPTRLRSPPRSPCRAPASARPPSLPWRPPTPACPAWQLRSPRQKRSSHEPPVAVGAVPVVRRRLPRPPPGSGRDLGRGASASAPTDLRRRPGPGGRDA